MKILILLFVAATAFAETLELSKEDIGNWTLWCDPQTSTTERPACVALQAVHAKDHPQWWIKLAVDVATTDGKAEVWMTIRTHVLPFPDKPIVILLDGRQLGNVYSKGCSAKYCETRFPLREDEVLKLQNAKNIMIETTIEKDRGAVLSLPLDGIREAIARLKTN
jgi:invasion protein IalB